MWPLRRTQGRWNFFHIPSSISQSIILFARVKDVPSILQMFNECSYVFFISCPPSCGRISHGDVSYCFQLDPDVKICLGPERGVLERAAACLIQAVTICIILIPWNWSWLSAMAMPSCLVGPWCCLLPCCASLLMWYFFPLFKNHISSV